MRQLESASPISGCMSPLHVPPEAAATSSAHLSSSASAHLTIDRWCALCSSARLPPRSVHCAAGERDG